MITKIKKAMGNLVQLMGFEVTKKDSKFQSMEKHFIETYALCRKYSMVHLHRMYATFSATRYIVNNGIEGDFVECGVWKGGSSMMMAMTLKQCKDTKRKIYLYDTYEGMTQPTKFDVQTSNNINAKRQWQRLQRKKENEWCYAPIDEVKNNMRMTRYPYNKFKFIKGNVLDTLDKEFPERIALLRLDTDFYESTKKEMEVLYPRLVENGVLLIDDYDSWRGSRKAIDEYFEKNKIKPLLHLTGNSGRMMIKTRPGIRH